jgi:hypothetical protein
MAEKQPTEIKELRVKVDSSSLEEKIKQNLEQQERIKALEEQQKEFEKYKSFYEKENSQGNIPMTPEMSSREHNNRTNNREFDSKLEMYQWLKLNDKTTFEKLKERSFNAIKGHSFEWSDSEFAENKDEPSIIMKTMKALNDKVRKNNGAQ